MPADLPGSEEPRTEGSAHQTSPIGPGWPADPAGEAAGTDPAAARDSTGPIGRAAPSGFPGPSRPGKRSRRPLILSGVAVIALLTGATVTLAATHTRSPSRATGAAAARSTPPSGQRPGRSGGAAGPFGGFGRTGFRRAGYGSPGFGRPGFGQGRARALHGQIVVAKPGGGFETTDIQTGQVTAVTATAITLKSADGFIRGYAVTKSTEVDWRLDSIGSVKTGHQVSLLATVNGTAVTATSIEDLTLLRQRRPSFGPPGQGAPTAPGSQAG